MVCIKRSDSKKNQFPFNPSGTSMLCLTVDPIPQVPRTVPWFTGSEQRAIILYFGINKVPSVSLNNAISSVLLSLMLLKQKKITAVIAFTFQSKWRQFRQKQLNAQKEFSLNHNQVPGGTQKLYYHPL